MVERPAQQRIVGVEGWIETATDAWVARPRHLAEQPRSARPGDVVEIAHDDRRAAIVAHHTANLNKLGIALAAVVAGVWRLGMYSVDHDFLPTAQPYLDVSRGDARLKQVRDGPFHRQARHQEYPVSIWDNFRYSKAIVCGERRDSLFPLGPRLQQ